MPKVRITVEYEVLNGSDLLPESDRQLLDVAHHALQGAWAPYSHFRVGAAVRLANGETVPGSNQENASYPAGLCAERVALFAAAAQHPDVAIDAIAITVKSGRNNGERKGPAAPCGMCRQAIAEYEQRYGRPIRLVLHGEDGTVITVSQAGSLLPLAFDAGYL